MAADRQTDRHADRKTDIQTDRQTYRHTHNFCKCSHASVGFAQARPNHVLIHYIFRESTYGYLYIPNSPFPLLCLIEIGQPAAKKFIII